MIVNTYVLNLSETGALIGAGINSIARKALTITLFFIGASLSRDVLKAVGIKPLVQGILLWVVISVSNKRQLTMTFQYIIHHLDKPHSWFIVLTNPHTELNTKKKLEQQGFITYVPLVSVRRCWEGCIKEIHIPAIARCVFVYATDENVLRMQKEYTILNPQAVIKLVAVIVRFISWLCLMVSKGASSVVKG